MGREKQKERATLRVPPRGPYFYLPGLTGTHRPTPTGNVRLDRSIEPGTSTWLYLSLTSLFSHCDIWYFIGSNIIIASRDQRKAPARSAPARSASAKRQREAPARSALQNQGKNECIIGCCGQKKSKRALRARWAASQQLLRSRAASQPVESFLPTSHARHKSHGKARTEQKTPHDPTT